MNLKNAEIRNSEERRLGVDLALRSKGGAADDEGGKHSESDPGEEIEIRNQSDDKNPGGNRES